VTQIAKSAAIDDVIRIRPSVSWVERPDNVIEFFLGNTRRQKRVRVASALVAALKQMNGANSLAAIACNLSIAPDQLRDWASELIDWSVAERISVAEWIQDLTWRRSLHMLADFIPDYDLQKSWKRLEETEFIILGCGAVGSWVADGIARIGGQRFVLVDPDTVALSNLNRSLFSASDVGLAKTTATAKRLRAIHSAVMVVEHKEGVKSSQDLGRMIPHDGHQVIVSCIDFPSVDVAAGLANRFCVERSIPLIVAGGYNLHLSLIGITIIPGETACFDCSLSYLKKSLGQDCLQVKKLPRPNRNIGNIAPLAAITASIASMEAIRVALDDDRLPAVMKGRRGEYNFMEEIFDWIQIPRQLDCKSCSSHFLSI
jgi:molybdopterin/thiamine biosynthesis adenylyltransferase